MSQVIISNMEFGAFHIKWITVGEEHTTCKMEVFPTANTIYQKGDGFAKVSEKDKFSFHYGLKLSLKRKLSQMDLDYTFKSRLWLEFFSQFPRPKKEKVQRKLPRKLWKKDLSGLTFEKISESGYPHKYVVEQMVQIKGLGVYYGYWREGVMYSVAGIGLTKMIMTRHEFLQTFKLVENDNS